MKTLSEIVRDDSFRWLEAVLAHRDGETQLQREITALEWNETPEPASLLAMAHILLTIADGGNALSPRFYIEKAQAFIRRAMDLQALHDEAAKAVLN